MRPREIGLSLLALTFLIAVSSGLAALTSIAWHAWHDSTPRAFFYIPRNADGTMPQYTMLRVGTARDQHSASVPFEVDFKVDSLGCALRSSEDANLCYLGGDPGDTITVTAHPSNPHFDPIAHVGPAYAP